VFQLLAHRIAWSFLLLVLVLFARRRLSDFRAVAFERRIVGTYVFAAALIGINWLTYIWAVNAGYIVEASLGYFISPLLHVLLGVLVFRERLRPLQWLPVAMAAIGVGYLTVTYGRLPWIALTLASSFGVYGVVKKLAPLDPLYGLTMETGVLFLPASSIPPCGVERRGASCIDTPTDLLLAGAGIATTVPFVVRFALAAFRFGARHHAVHRTEPAVFARRAALQGSIYFQAGDRLRIVWGLIFLCEAPAARRSARSLNEEVLAGDRSVNRRPRPAKW
jgi:chloramphenicol-sensitive protein RarD